MGKICGKAVICYIFPLYSNLLDYMRTSVYAVWTVFFKKKREYLKMGSLGEEDPAAIALRPSEWRDLKGKRHP